MTFTSLEQRFTQASKQIYSRFSPSVEQLVQIKPDTNGVFGSNSRIKDDSRALPVVSTTRDVSRMSKFLGTNDGVLFLGKQTLLQTGNTFAETRLYNPLSTLINAVPFVGRGSARHIPIPFKLDSIKTPTRTSRGALQNETLNSFSTPNTNAFRQLGRQFVNAATSPFNVGKATPSPTEYFGTPTKEFYLRPEDKAFYYKNGTVKQLNLPFVVSGNFTYYPTDNSGVGPTLFKVQPLADRGTKKVAGGLPDITFVDRYPKFATQRPVNKPGTKTFKQLENTLQTNGYFSGKQTNTLVLSPTVDNVQLAKGELTPGSSIRYPGIRDPYNGVRADARNARSVNPQTDTQNVRTLTSTTPAVYDNIAGDVRNISEYGSAEKTDIIKFIFTTNLENAQPVHFRAFLSSLKQNVKADYNEQRYLGRTERFVTYGGAKRTATLQFNIAAFSADELNQAWARVNYLTGLAFPLGISQSGFLIPPLFKLTIGGIYENQPCYIESLDFDFIDDTTTFDIDSEVTQVINVNMSVTLLEKRSKFYDSPFYAIVENLQTNTGN